MMFRRITLLVVAVWMAGFPAGIGGQEVTADAETMIQANKVLFAGEYQKALDLYGQISRTDAAMVREATLARCLCFAMLGFTANDPEEAIANFRKLIQEANQGAPLQGLEDGNLPINRRFISDLFTIFGKTGSLGGGDVTQGLILQSDTQYPPGTQIIEELGTEAQKQFTQFFGWSMHFSAATVKLAAKDFESCLTEAAKVKTEKPEHIPAESKALQTHARNMVAAKGTIEELKSVLEKFQLEPNDPNAAIVEQAKGLTKQLQKLFTK